MAKAKKFKREDRSKPYLNILDVLVKEKTFLAIVIIGIIMAEIARFLNYTVCSIQK